MPSLAMIVPVGLAIVPNPIDPALEHGRHRPPPDWEDDDGGLIALDPLHLPNDSARIDFVRIAPIGLIRLTQHRVEPPETRFAHSISCPLSAAAAAAAVSVNELGRT